MYWSFQYSLTSQDLESNNRKLRMKPKSSAFTLITFAIGHWLPLASVFSSTMSSFWKFLHLLFHFGRVWRLHKTASSHITQNSFAMCWIHLCLLLLNSSAFTNWPGGDNTTLDFIVRILLGHSGCSLWTSPKMSTVSALDYNIVSVSASSVLNGSSFNGLPCVLKRDNRMPLPLPNTSHVTGRWRVSMPDDVICMKEILNLLMVHFFEGIS